MTKPTPCGSWPSPLSPTLIATSGVRLMQPRVADSWAYWLESRPAENGRSILVRGQPGVDPEDVTPLTLSVRSRVHEYGGGAYAISHDTLFFVNDSDQQIYRSALPGHDLRRLTNAPGCRFADLLPDRIHQRLVCICEDHTQEPAEPVNSLVSVPFTSGTLSTLASGYDFYSSPVVHPAGTQLAWLCWNHPSMPWDACELWLAELTVAGALQNPRRIAGGSHESLFEPQFAPDGTLHFLSDRNGFWNIYKYVNGQAHAVSTISLDHGFAQWQFGMSSYGFTDEGELLATRLHKGSSQLVRIHAGNEIQVATNLTQIEHVHIQGRRMVLLASDTSHMPAIILYEDEKRTLLYQAEPFLAPEFVSEPEAINFLTTGGESAHAWFYPPHHPDCSIPLGTKPPLLVKCHGGPTAMNGNGLDLRIQFWTSRGFAVVDVNYRGSSGYGRDYRRSLYGQWGIKDVDDCMAAARHLVMTGRVDGERLIISGSSAGGFTALSALVFHDFFKAGAIYYGISELASAMTKTHKFEAHYGDSLLGTWPADRAIYQARSPLYAAEHINCPVIFFQGLKDPVVPPDQTERMVQSLRMKKMPVAYLTFPAEGHGFRRREAIQRALEAELSFYGQIFGYTPADACPPLQIENLP